MRTTVAIAGALLASTMNAAYAAPPEVGTSEWKFVDPVYQAVVVCDTLEQIRQIVDSDDPQREYLKLTQTLNRDHEPICAAMLVKGDVLEVYYLGTMSRDHMYFNSWSVKISSGRHIGWVLWIEQTTVFSI